MRYEIDHLSSGQKPGTFHPNCIGHASSVHLQRLSVRNACSQGHIDIFAACLPFQMCKQFVWSPERNLARYQCSCFLLTVLTFQSENHRDIFPGCSYCWTHRQGIDHPAKKSAHWYNLLPLKWSLLFICEVLLSQTIGRAHV